MKLQERKLKIKDKIYGQPWITLPTKLTEALGWSKGTELKVLIDKGGLVLKRK